MGMKSLMVSPCACATVHNDSPVVSRFHSQSTSLHTLSVAIGRTSFHVQGHHYYHRITESLPPDYLFVISHPAVQLLASSALIISSSPYCLAKYRTLYEPDPTSAAKAPSPCLELPLDAPPGGDRCQARLTGGFSSGGGSTSTDPDNA